MVILANAFLSSGQGKIGPEPLIKFVVQPKEHVIVPIRSFVLLHCEANFTDYPDYEYENDDPYTFPSDTDYMINDEPNDGLHQQLIDSKDSTTTDSCQQDVQYQWQRNDKPITVKNTSFIKTFCNGTIKIMHSSMATAIYRCVASTKNSEVGAIISKAAHVKAAGKFC